MAYIPLTPLVQQFFDNLGDPLVGGTLNAYVAGTSTPTNFYSDNTGTVAGSSITLDSRGEPTTVKLLWVDSTVTYKFILKDSTGTTIWSEDNISVSEVTDGSVTSAKLANNSVIASKIASSAVTSSKIADTSVTYSKLANSGNELGFRNLFHNGGFRIQQRLTFDTYGTSLTYGPDRWASKIISGTQTGGQFRKTAAAWASTGYSGAVTFTTASNVYMQYAYRMEAAESSLLNGKTITVSGKVYHNGNSSLDFYIGINKANASDNFTTTTLVSTSTTFSASSATATSFSKTFTLGASDATNGLEFVIYNSSSTLFTASSSPTVAIADMQLEIGSNATPLQLCPLPYEMMICQRYFERGTFYASGYYADQKTLLGNIYFKVTKRVFPNIVQTNNPSQTNCPATPSYLSPFNDSLDSFTSYRLSNGPGFVFYCETWTASADL